LQERRVTVARVDDRLARDPDAIRTMFSRVASRYDLLNHLNSLRRDVGWRRRLVASLADAPAGTVLDLATGTGDVALAIHDRPAVGVDFCLEMLEIARTKARSVRRRLPLVAADALALPLHSASVAAVTISFGVRNFVDLDAGLREIARVLVQHGIVAILELHRPRRRTVAAFAKAWNRLVTTPLGRIISADREAYAYLPASIDTFADRAELATRLASVGFEVLESRDLSAGIAALTVARKEEA
jgi:demethylmenaquinone methyltransferase/2-methoxy-6-polyprenyl-1,4-benzoquinol methylase